MKVILTGELRGKGGEGDIVDVAQGYAENYLFPKRMALPATPGNIKQLEERRHNIAKREEKRIADAEAIKASLDGKSITVEVRVGEEGQLFGSVTTAMIADAVAEQLEVEIDRKRIERSAAIKTAGTHAVVINLYRDIEATINVVVGADLAAAQNEAEQADAEPEADAAAEAVAEDAEAEQVEAPADAE